MTLIGEISALITAVCWSGSSIAFAGATTRVGSVYVNVARLLIAAFVLALIVLLFGISLSVSSTQLIYLAASGLIGLVFGDTFLFKSYEYNGARISALIMSTAPAISAVLAYLFLDELLAIWGIVGIGVTLAGIALVVMGRTEPHSTVARMSGVGVFYALLGAAGQGGGLILAKMAFAESTINGIAATLIRIVAAILVLLPLSRLTGRFKTPIAVFSSDRRAFGLTVLGAILGPCLGITFSLISIAHTDVAVAATLMATVPILMLPLVRIIYREELTWRAYSGAFIAVAGVAILFLR